MFYNYYLNGFGGYKLRQLNQNKFQNPYGNRCVSYFIFDSLIKLGTDTWLPLHQIVDKTIASMSSVQEGDQSYWSSFRERMRSKGLNPTDHVSDRILKLMLHSHCKLEVLGASIKYDHRQEGLFICLNTSLKKGPEHNPDDMFPKKRWGLKTITQLLVSGFMCIKNLIHP
jgi:hypothetical protein